MESVRRALSLVAALVLLTGAWPNQQALAQAESEQRALPPMFPDTLRVMVVQATSKAPGRQVGDETTEISSRPNPDGRVGTLWIDARFDGLMRGDWTIEATRHFSEEKRDLEWTALSGEIGVVASRNLSIGVGVWIREKSDVDLFTEVDNYGSIVDRANFRERSTIGFLRARFYLVQ